MLHQPVVDKQSAVQEEHVARRVLIEEEEIQLLADDAVIAFLSLLHQLRVGFLCLLGQKGVAIEAVVGTMGREEKRCYVGSSLASTLFALVTFREAIASDE